MKKDCLKKLTRKQIFILYLLWSFLFVAVVLILSLYAPSGLPAFFGIF